jgi:autotransporter-associated beta strand protein
MTSGNLAGNVVAGGPGGAGVSTTGISGGAGYALGSGIFLRGSTSAVLDPSPGQTVDVADVIADAAAPIGTSPGEGTGNVVVAGGGLVRLDAANTYSGTTVLEQGTTLDITHSRGAGFGQVLFEGPGTLQLASGVVLGVPIGGLANGDAIDLLGLPGSGGAASVVFDPGSQMLTVSGGGGQSVELQVNAASGAASSNFIPSMDAGGTGTEITYVACFAAGTHIRTVDGARKVERLRVGDAVRTQDGASAPVRWLGRRRMEPAPEAAWPVRIAHGAFAAAAPARALLLSPDHAICVDGALIPVRYLVNGATIARRPVHAIEYWHVELDRHAVVFAEGLPCESYLDTGNRSAFDASGGSSARSSAR